MGYKSGTSVRLSCLLPTWKTLFIKPTYNLTPSTWVLLEAIQFYRLVASMLHVAIPNSIVSLIAPCNIKSIKISLGKNVFVKSYQDCDQFDQGMIPLVIKETVLHNYKLYFWTFTGSKSSKKVFYGVPVYDEMFCNYSSPFLLRCFWYRTKVKTWKKAKNSWAQYTIYLLHVLVFGKDGLEPCWAQT